MGLREMARKGLSLFVEMNPETGDDATQPAATAGGPPLGGGAAAGSESEEAQRLRSKSVADLLKELDGPEPEQIQQAVQAAGPVLAASGTPGAADGGPVDFAS